MYVVHTSWNGQKAVRTQCTSGGGTGERIAERILDSLVAERHASCLGVLRYAGATKRFGPWVVTWCPPAQSPSAKSHCTVDPLVP